MDGEITIGTTLSTDKFDKQIADLQKKMQREEDKKIIIKTQLDTQTRELEEARERTDELADAYQRLKEIRANPNVFRARFGEYGEIKSQFGDLQEIERNFNKALNRQDALEQKVVNTELKYKQINDRISEYNQKIKNTNIQKQVADVEKLKSGFSTVGSSIQNSIKNVARLALGIFGIRTAINVLSRASSNLASYDQQYAANIEYIRYALTQMIAPVLQWIVRLAATLLGYINAILQGWFGINLFSRGSAKNFNKMKAGASGVSKAVKEIKKQLAGFDEMNVLSDQSSGGTGGGGGVGGAMPDFDLSKMQGEPPAWLQWIINNRDLILAVMAGITSALIAWRLGLDGIKALGIGLLIAGIVYSIQSLIEYLKDPSWKNFGKIIQGIGVAIVGLGILIGSVPLIVIGAIVLIVGTIIKYWDKIKEFFQNGIDWLSGKSDWVHNMFGDTIGNIYDMFVNNLQQILNIFDSTFKMIKGIFDGIITFVKGVFTGNWKQAWEGIKQIFSSVWEGIKNIFIAKFNIIKNMVTTVAKTTGSIIASVFKAVVNAVLRTIENVLNSPIRSINSLIGVINEVPGINLRRLNTFNLPRLKSGAILNVPNKGTLVGGGSAIAGEAGHEGYLPLTDQQAMATLGREIGKWININATIPISVGNRQIAREMKRINAEDDFAYNS